MSVTTILYTGVAYFIAAKLGLLLAFAQTNATPVWPPTGIALAVCLMFGQRVWPGIFLGAFFANLTMLTGGFSWMAAFFLALSTAAGNTLEALLGALLVLRCTNGRHSFDRTHDTLCFIIFGAMVSTMVSATIGSASFCFYSGDWLRFARMWLTWWLGDGVGAILFAPLLLNWDKQRLTGWTPSKFLEALALLVLLLAMEALVFGVNLPLEYLVAPLLLWTAYRFSQFETSVAILLVTGSSLVWTILGYGPFAGSDLNNALLFLQSFMAVTAVTTLVVSVLTGERKRVEERLLEYQSGLEILVAERTAELKVARDRAEAADQLKSAFLATMSHELRTPLNSIIGFTGILLQELGGPINDEQRKQLGMVRNSANHLLSLISDILDISKIESGQLKVTSEAVDLKSSIFKAAQSIRPMAEKKGLDLTVEVSEQVGSVNADERRVEQVLLNLLSNAVKFTEQGYIAVNCRREADCYLTTVTDTGAGIREDDLADLFRPFHQIDTGLSRKYEGTGLGLSICKKLVERMGGSIQVESCYGKGSTFGFRLPVAGSRAL